MKKLLTILSAMLIVLSLVGCSGGSDNPGNSTKEVASASEFSSLGFIIDAPTIGGITDIKYSIEDKNVARVDFNYSNHAFTFKASKDKKPAEMLGFVSTPYNAETFEVNDMTFAVANYDEGSAAAWTANEVFYSLFGGGLQIDDLQGFGRMTVLCAGIEIPEEPTVDLPEKVEGMTKDEIDKWLYDNNFSDIDYEYKGSTTVEKDHVIGLSKSGTVHPYDEIIVYISTGPGEGDVVLVPDYLCGKTEVEFVEFINKLNLVPIRLGTNYYSTTIVRGSVYKYDDGKFPTGTEIKYNLSVGPYEFVDTDYNGKTVDQVNAMVASLNNLNAHINFAYKEVQTNDHTHGLTYGCTATKDNITTNVACSLAKPVEDTRVDLPNFVGTYNNPCPNSNACSVNGINYEIFFVCDGNPNGYISAQTVNPGKVARGTGVGLTISTEMPYLHNAKDTNFYSKYQCDTPDETEEALKNDKDLKHFDYLVFERDMSGAGVGGEVVNVLIWDKRGYWVTDFETGRYPKDTPVRIQIAEMLLR